MGIIGKIFKGKLNAEKTREGIFSGINNMFFTEQEKAEYYKKVADRQLEFYKASLSESTIRSKTRRMVSYFIVFLFSLVILLYIRAVEFDFVEKKESYWELLTDSALGTGFLGVLAFFFGGYYLKQFKKEGK